jgi:hypothetical protein
VIYPDGRSHVFPTVTTCLKFFHLKSDTLYKFLKRNTVVMAGPRKGMYFLYESDYQEFLSSCIDGQECSVEAAEWKLNTVLLELTGNWDEEHHYFKRRFEVAKTGIRISPKIKKRKIPNSVAEILSVAEIGC